MKAGQGVAHNAKISLKNGKQRHNFFFTMFAYRSMEGIPRGGPIVATIFC